MDVMAEPAAHFFHSRRLRLHYVQWGDPQAPVVILLHGGRDHCRNWDGVARELTRDWRVIAPDLRGHGDSDWTSDGQYSFDAYVWDLLSLYEHLGIARADLVGHSLGGNITLRFAAMFPELVRSLVCIEGFFPDPAILEMERGADVVAHARQVALQRQRLDRLNPRSHASLEEAVALMKANNPHLDIALCEHLARHGTRRTEAGRWVWKFDPCSRKPTQRYFSEEEIMAFASQVRCPVLLPWGAKSFLVLENNRQRIAALAHAHVSVYPNAGHWPHHDDLPRFVSEVRCFLKAAGSEQPLLPGDGYRFGAAAG